MKRRLTYLLDRFKINDDGKKDKVLEIMAGCGRNVPILRKYFRQITMIDAVKKNV